MEPATGFLDFSRFAFASRLPHQYYKKTIDKRGGGLK